MYDGDYDVLYALVKDKIVYDGKTFEQIIANYSTSNGYDCPKWPKKEPLMTIFIPDLEAFSPNTWNVDSQIPDVVIDNSHFKGDTGKLVAFSSSLRQFEVDAKVAPTTPVVVIKENERIVAKSKSPNGTSKRESGLAYSNTKKVIAQNDNHSFYFIGDSDPRKANQEKKQLSGKSNARLATWESLPKSLREMHSYYSSLEQRDWVYYHLLPPTWEIGEDRPDKEGEFASMHVETIRGFKLASPSVLQAISENWTEGNLEFHITHTFITRDGIVPGPDLKVFYCNRSSLMNSSNVMLDYNPEVPLLPWDMRRYGEEWKLSILEHDPAGSISRTKSAQSTFGYNFELSGQLWKKLGVKFGTTGTFGKSNSTTVTESTGSDVLGDVRVLFTDPIIISNNSSGYTTKTYFTGSIYLSVEPKETSPDPRYPYIN